MSELLDAPPLLEALCEIVVRPEVPWDLTVAGGVYEHLKGSLPERIEVPAKGFFFVAGTESPIPAAPPPSRIQFRSTPDGAMVQVGTRLIAINQSAPYPGWTRFAERIERAISALREVVPELVIERIGLRYVNLLEHPGPVEQVLTLGPRVPEALNHPLGAFHQRYEFLHFEPHGVLVHQTGTGGMPDGRTGYVLDLLFQSVDQTPPTLEEARTWLEGAHERIGEAFVASLTEAAYVRSRGPAT